MKTRNFTDFLLLLLSAVLMTFCSSGGGTGGTGIISRGTITEFGSIVVNGTEFDTSDAVVMVRGEEVGIGDAAVLQHLDIGRVVTVVGSGSEDMADAVADEVAYRSDVTGPVTGVSIVDSETRELQVLGQTVVLNRVTQLEGTGFDTVAANDVVEVSGYHDDAGTVWATFIEKIGEFGSGITVEVVGLVTNLNEDLHQFDIAGLRVDYAYADLRMLPAGSLQNGLLVEVAGILDTIDGALQATRIVPADSLEVEEAGQIEVMGFVTQFTSIYEFVVGHQRVQVNTDVEVVDGTLDDIGFGVKLEAEGVLSGGILYADEIEFWLPDQIEVEGIVMEITASGFYVGSQEVVTGAKTIYEDGTPADISNGIKIEVKGRLAGGILLAYKVSFELE